MRKLLLPGVLALALVAPGPASASHPQPATDINKLDYSPIGHFKPGGQVPASPATACEEVGIPHLKGKVFNPSGKWNAFDNNVFEVFCLPYRQSNDESNSDPYGNNGGRVHGTCGGQRTEENRPGNQAYQTGVCPNHQLEYVEYYEETMKEILGEFGVTFRRYEFQVDAGDTPVLTNTMSGRAINPAAIVTGADHPEETIVIGAHYDQTNDGPASVWDSAEGHAEIIRVAKKMADYWRATGTRPAATVKFIPWDGEESGVLGSLDYVNNNVVPGEENKVRGYWNTDPCAGGYPSFQYNNPAYRITMGVQVASPAFIGQNAQPVADPDLDRTKRFNDRAPLLIEQVLDHLDDKAESTPGQPELFISASEGASDLGKPGGIQLTTTDPVLFGSDWVNFISLGIPFFNPGPSTTGPEEQDDNPSNAQPPDPFGTADGLSTFHTPNDNWLTMNRYTGGDPTGTKWSETYMKGMEFCAHMLGWGMLQHDQGGTQKTDDKPVAYYEALPNEAEKGKLVTFNAGGSYQYSSDAARSYVDEKDLQLKWEFGDGRTAFGKVVKHAYRQEGVFPSRLTVTNRATGDSDTMDVPITVVEGEGSESDPAGQDSDPGLYLKQNQVVACQSSTAFRSAAVKVKGRTLRISATTSGSTPVVAELFQATRGGKPKRRASAVLQNGRATIKGKRSLRKGSYYVKVTTRAGSRKESRLFTLTLARTFKRAKPFLITPSCDLVSAFSLGQPLIPRKGLTIAVATTQSAKVTVLVKRGKKVVKRFKRTVPANRGQRFSIPGRRLRKGTYSVRLTAVSASAKKSFTLFARK